MGKVGPWVTDLKAGVYCKITLDSGEKIVVNHEHVGLKSGWLTIEHLTLLGFSSERIFVCNLDSREGKTALSVLTRAPQESVDVTPLGAFVQYLKSCQSVAEVKARCTSLMAIR